MLPVVSPLACRAMGSAQARTELAPFDRADGLAPCTRLCLLLGCGARPKNCRAPRRPDREGRVAKFVIAKQAVGTRVRKRVSDYPPQPSSAKPAPANSIEANPLFFASEVGQVVEGKPCCTGELHRDPRDGWASVIEPPAYKEGVWFRVRRHDPAKLTVTGSK